MIIIVSTDRALGAPIGSMDSPVVPRIGEAVHMLGKVYRVVDVQWWNPPASWTARELAVQLVVHEQIPAEEERRP